MSAGWLPSQEDQELPYPSVFSPCGRRPRFAILNREEPKYTVKLHDQHRVIVIVIIVLIVIEDSLNPLAYDDRYADYDDDDD